MSADLAIFSGYQLKLEDFPEFIKALIGKEPKQGLPPPHLVAKYVRWRENLSPSAGVDAPNIRYRVLTQGGTDVTHIFFPTRSIPYENASQLEDPNNYDRIEAHKETDKDREKLKKWLNYINANTRGNPFSSSKFEFSVILERVDTRIDK